MRQKWVLAHFSDGQTADDNTLHEPQSKPKSSKNLQEKFNWLRSNYQCNCTIRANFMPDILKYQTVKTSNGNQTNVGIKWQSDAVEWSNRWRTNCWSMIIINMRSIQHQSQLFISGLWLIGIPADMKLMLYLISNTLHHTMIVATDAHPRWHFIHLFIVRCRQLLPHRDIHTSYISMSWHNSSMILFIIFFRQTLKSYKISETHKLSSCNS